MAPNSSSDRPPQGRIDLGYLGEHLPYLTRVIRAYIRAENDEFYRDLDVQQGDVAILHLIGINPGVSQNELAAALVLKKSAVTKIIKDLEDRGLVDRKKVSSDKRYNALSLTEAGEAKRQQLQDGARRQYEAFLAGFSKREKTQLMDMLRRLGEHLAERNQSRQIASDDD